MIVRYKCRFIDTTKDYEIENEEGIVGASTYAGAVSAISQYYGEDKIMGLELDAFEDPVLKEDIDETFFT